jgi:hypothetical protein
LLREASKPVLLVPPDAAGTPDTGLERVVVALDGSDEVSSALRSVVEEVLPRGTDVLAVHVFEGSATPSFWDRPGRDARLWEGEFLARHYDQPGAQAVLQTASPARWRWTSAVRARRTRSCWRGAGTTRRVVP